MRQIYDSEGGVAAITSLVFFREIYFCAKSAKKIILLPLLVICLCVCVCVLVIS